MERKFTRVYDDEDVIETWTFDLKKFERGPISVDIIYPKGYEHTPAVNDNFAGIKHCISNVKTVSAKQLKKALKKTTVPLSKQKFTNPKNGKKVSYARAKALGLI